MSKVDSGTSASFQWQHWHQRCISGLRESGEIPHLFTTSASPYRHCLTGLSRWQQQQQGSALLIIYDTESSLDVLGTGTWSVLKYNLWVLVLVLACQVLVLVLVLEPQSCIVTGTWTTGTGTWASVMYWYWYWYLLVEYLIQDWQRVNEQSVQIRLPSRRVSCMDSCCNTSASLLQWT